MALPVQLPQPGVPFLQTDADGNLTDQVAVIWYLWLYNLSKQVSGGSGAGLPTSGIDQVDMIDLEASSADPLLARLEAANALALQSVSMEISSTDALQARREALNSLLLMPDLEMASPRDIINALTLALDPLLQEAAPRAQPAQAITVGASPFTYTALFPGAVAVSGTVSAITLIRQGVSVPTGITAGGVIPVSRLDQLLVTYLSAPTMNFLPT